MDTSVAQCLHTASGAESRPLVFGSLLVLSVATGKRVLHSDSSMFLSLLPNACSPSPLPYLLREVWILAYRRLLIPAVWGCHPLL